MFLRCAILSIVCLLTVWAGHAQSADVKLVFTTDVDVLPEDSVEQYFIRHIAIEGNGRTRPVIIHRELDLAVGDNHPLSYLAEQLLHAKNALMRSGLFRGVSLSLIRVAPRQVDISIQVEERWYLFPMPFIKPVDYSVMEWLADENRELRRINYGMHLTHRNFTGRADRLNLSLVNGFSQMAGVQYAGLYLDKALKWYSSISLQYGRNRAVGLTGTDNRRLNVHTASNDFVHHYFNAFADVTYRPAIKARHTFGLGFVEERVSDTVFKLAPGFSAEDRNIRYVNIFYRMAYADVDLMAYPTRGRITEISAIKKGFSRSIALWQVGLRNAFIWPVKNRYILNLRTAGTLKLPFDQPRMTKGLIGHEGMSMQGYEDYLIEGVAGGYVKASLARPLFGKTLYAPARLVPQKLQRFRAVPLKLYGRAFVSSGYVYDPQPATASLSNRFLCSAGLGLDVVAFADWVIKIEWSLNLLGQNGIYLHPHSSF